jgi:nicotinamidase-related amidase
MNDQTLPIPPHFDATEVGTVWRVPYEHRATAAEHWALTHKLAPASQDQRRVCLLLVDCQNTFCIPGFELFVSGRSGSGAVEDNLRLCRFIYRNLSAITQIIPTLDTHTALQIFHPVFWIDRNGDHPKGGQTIITLKDVVGGKWKVNPAVAPLGAADGPEALQRYAVHYVRSLTESGKYPLLVWPYHSMLGGIGHALVSAVEEAVFFHSVARKCAPRFRIKGDNPLTEHYSVLRPEVQTDQDGRPIAAPDRDFVQTLLDYDAIIIAGQAKSHCVAWSVDDMISEARGRGQTAVRKIYLLEDCTSAVVVPGVVDFTDQADAAFRRFAAAGVQIVQSTVPMHQWLEVGS